MTKEKLTRRAFLSAAPAGAAAVAGFGIATTAAASAAAPERWDAETAVLVLGYGGAGAVAAVTAHDAGARVLILEKQAAGAHVTNTHLSAGLFLSPDNVADATAYLEVASRVNVDMPESKDLDDESIRVWAEESVRNRDWLTQMGAPGFVLLFNAGRTPNWPGNAGIKAYLLTRPEGGTADGSAFFAFLSGLVTQRSIPVAWRTPATRLVRGPDGDVLGAIASRADGSEIAVRALRAVIVTTGGFEFDEAAQKAYMPAYPMTYLGSPDNTGDGLRMCQAVGADLWHMPGLAGSLKFKFDDFPTAFQPSFGSGAYMIVDKHGRRFRSETQFGGYDDYWHALVYDTEHYTWPRLPSWYVFDEKRRRAGRLVPTGYGAAGPTRMYEWSADNSAEIARGWILASDTIEGLAAQMGADPGALVDQVAQFNAAVAGGADTAFGRPAGSMAAFDTPPFYAMRLLPSHFCTLGGPRRNARSQVLDPFGVPIPRLYSAGELGSIFVQYPQGGGAISECLALGRVAGANAAAEPLA